MKGITAAIVSAFPIGAPWFSKTDAAPPAAPDQADDDAVGEWQSLNNRLVSLLHGHALLANDRKRLNALLAELVDERDQVVASKPDRVPASVIASFDSAVDGIVKSLNQHFATNGKSSIVPGQSANGQ